MPDTLDTLIKQLEEKRIELRVISGMFDRFDPDYHKKEKKRVIGEITIRAAGLVMMKNRNNAVSIFSINASSKHINPIPHDNNNLYPGRYHGRNIWNYYYIVP